MTIIQFIDSRFASVPWHYMATFEIEHHFETDFEIDLILDYLIHDSSIDGILLGKTTKVMNLFSLLTNPSLFL